MPRGVDELDEARLQGRLWTPAQVLPAVWLDAADLSTITIATGVSEWRDKSGNNRHATQATTSLQPDYSQFALNGRPGLIWPVVAGATSINRVLYTTSFDIGISNIAATFVVARMDSGSAMNSFRRLFVNNSSGYSLWYFGTGSSSQTMLQIAGTATIGADWTVGTERNSPFVLSMVGPNNGGVAANNLRSRLNGGIRTNTRTDATGTVGGTSQLAIGAVEAGYTTGQYSWSGEISEIVHFNTTLSPHNVNIIEGYLAWKWGIRLAAEHPFANRPPLIGD